MPTRLLKGLEEVLGLCTGELPDGRIPTGAANQLIDNGSNIPFFSERALNSKENWSDFDSAIRRFESSRPSQYFVFVSENRRAKRV